MSSSLDNIYICFTFRLHFKDIRISLTFLFGCFTHSSIMFHSVQNAVALILQSSPTQRQLWKISLESQGFTVIKDTPSVDILRSIVKFQPNVAIVDISEGTFNPFEISRKSAVICPSAAIMFTNHKRKEIYPSERNWAMKQKAADLISAPKTIRALKGAVARIVAMSGSSRSFDPDALSHVISPPSSNLNSAVHEPPDPIDSYPPSPRENFQSKPEDDSIKPVATVFAHLMERNRASGQALDNPPQSQPLQTKKPQVMFRGRPIY